MRCLRPVRILHSKVAHMSYRLCNRHVTFRKPLRCTSPYLFTVGAEPGSRVIPTNFRVKLWIIRRRHRDHQAYPSRSSCKTQDSQTKNSCSAFKPGQQVLLLDSFEGTDKLNPKLHCPLREPPAIKVQVSPLVYRVKGSYSGACAVSEHLSHLRSDHASTWLPAPDFQQLEGLSFEKNLLLECSKS